MKATALKLLILSLVMGGVGFAQDDEDPGRGVARVSLINGDVSVRRGDSGDWVAAAVNAPLVVEDAVLTGISSRAEVQFDWANIARLSSNTEVRLAELETQRYIIQVARGLITFRVERDSDADIEISTPSVSVRPTRKGSYRILVREDGDSEITVREGEAEIFTPRGSERLRAGKTMLAKGSPADPEYRIVNASGRDEWDRWNESRDDFYARSSSYRYVDRSVYGVEDLDGYGSWVWAPPYGWVWAPRVASGWAPYYNGRWSWMDYYGWNWVSYDPWGWAPYHYGRWFHSAGRGWCWWPGALRTRHYWSPGLVAFFGWGNWSGFHAGIGLGHVGWIPLAPYETYHRWYGRGYYRGYRNGTYIDNSVHIVNNTNIVNVYKNARISNAVTGVDASQFGRGNGQLIRVSSRDMGRVDLVRGQMPVAPGRESLRVSNRELTVQPAPRAAANERFYSRRQPATVDRVPFEQQQRSMEQVARRTFGEPANVRRTEAAKAPAAASAPRAPADTGSAGWRRVSETPRAETQDRQPAESWRRFGGTTTPSAPARTPESAAPQTRSVPAETAAPRNQDNGWRRFEGNNSGSTSRPDTVRSTPRSAPSDEAPRSSAPRSEAPRTERNSGGGQIRINPPIIREREAPRAAPSRPSEAPRPSPPAPSAPTVRQAPSAPAGGATRSAPSAPTMRQAPSAPSGGATRSAPSAPSQGASRTSGSTRNRSR